MSEFRIKAGYPIPMDPPPPSRFTAEKLPGSGTDVCYVTDLETGRRARVRPADYPACCAMLYDLFNPAPMPKIRPTEDVELSADG